MNNAGQTVARRDVMSCTGPDSGRSMTDQSDDMSTRRRLLQGGPVSP